MSLPEREPTEPGRDADVERRIALRERHAPDHLFDGFFEAVEEGLAFAPPGGGISSAFLDAPRSLRIWRTTALAAMVVIGLGAGYLRSVDPTTPVPTRGEERLTQIPPRLAPAWPTVRSPTPLQNVKSNGEESPEHWFVLSGPAAVPGGGRVVSQEEHWD